MDHLNFRSYYFSCNSYFEGRFRPHYGETGPKDHLPCGVFNWSLYLVVSHATSSSLKLYSSKKTYCSCFRRAPLGWCRFIMKTFNWAQGSIRRDIRGALHASFAYQTISLMILSGHSFKKLFVAIRVRDDLCIVLWTYLCHNIIKLPFGALNVCHVLPITVLIY